MIALIATNDEARAVGLQERLHRAEIDCPRSSIVSVPMAKNLLKAGKSVDLLFVMDGEGTQQLTENIRALRTATAAAIVAVGPDAATEHVLSAIRAGACDYINAGGNLDSDVPAVVTRLRAAIPAESSAGTTICIVAASGGCGVSTLAVNLSVCLGRAQQECCLIDLKVRGGDLATLLNLRGQHTIVDLCFQGERLDETMFRQTLLPHTGHVKLLAAPPLLSDQGNIDSQVVAQVFALAGKSFPYVVIDLEDVVHREQARAVRDCHALLIVLRLDFPCIVRTRRLLDYLREAEIDMNKVKLVVNRVGNVSLLPRKQALEALGAPIFHVLPEDEKAMLTSVNVGNPVVLEAPQSPIAKAYRRLAELLQTI